MSKKIILSISLLLTVCSFVMAQNTATTDEGVIINGIKWATRNVDAPGTFAANPEDAGMFFQWNHKTAWPSANDIIGWNDSYPTGSIWEKANDPSPSGWRIPTADEIKSLLDTNKVTNEWTTENGINGRKFTDKASGHSLFLPAAGYRDDNVGLLFNVGSYGLYWSSSQYEDDEMYAYYLHFSSGYANRYGVDRPYGFSVRCVSE
jgi:uncharacterized protein (TIGR02145 family)